MAHLVTFRTSEIGLRMALGASPGVVMRMVLSHGRRLTLIGIVAGIAGALAVSRLLQQTLFEVDATNPSGRCPSSCVFHLGVHGISPASIDGMMDAFAAYTAGSPTGAPRVLGELLDALSECPETVVVLNHPCWDPDQGRSAPARLDAARLSARLSGSNSRSS